MDIPFSSLPSKCVLEGSVNRHFDPFVFGPECLQHAARLCPAPVSMTDDPCSMESCALEHEENIGRTERIRFGQRKIGKGGTVKHIQFPPHDPVSPVSTPQQAVFASIRLLCSIQVHGFQLTSKGVLLHPHLTEMLSGKRQLCFDFLATQTSLSRTILQQVLRGERVVLPSDSMVEFGSLCSQRASSEGGTYLALTVDDHHTVQGIYVGRTHSLAGRATDHDINLSILMHTNKSASHIENLLYQNAAQIIQKGGRLVLVAANVIPNVSQRR